MPWFNLSDADRPFVTTASLFDWVVQNIDWPSWLKTDEARQLLENPKAIAYATLIDLERLLTTHVQADRSTESHLAPRSKAVA